MSPVLLSGNIMMRKVVISGLLILVFTITWGQKTSVQGVVVDKSTGENISFATVAILAEGEQNALTGTVSDKNGVFSLGKIPYGTYRLIVSFLGYRSGEFSELTLSPETRDIDLGRIELEPDAIAIDEVEVKASARTSVSRIDRIRYRASDFETARGGTAIDVLGKLPSVTIDSENDISVRGSSDFVVYLNGKPTSADVSVLLGQIPGENIESIDIITVPTSRYEAQGKGGIINITTKRDTRTGLTVRANGMAGGTPWKNGTDVFSNHVLNNNRVSGGLNLNYNMNRLNIHAAINYLDKNNKGNGDIYTYIYQDASQPGSGSYYILDGGGARPKWDQALYTNLGIDFQLTEKSEISANYQYSTRHTGRAAHYKYNTFFSDTPTGEPIPGTLYELYNPNDIHRRGDFRNLSLDYRLRAGENAGLTASFLYEQSNLEQTIENKEYPFTGNTLYYDYYSDTHGNPVFHSFQRDETPFEAYRLALNYRKAFDDGSSLEFGANSQHVRLEGIYEYDTVNTTTGSFEGFDYFNNTLDLQRDVYAAYLDYSGSLKKLSYIIGLRMEYLDQVMNVSSTQYFDEVYEVFGEIGRDFNRTDFGQNEFSLFPSLHLRYNLDENNRFSLAASRRINRPPAKDMAPFLYRRHQEIFEMGDPLLEPEYSWNADLSYNRLLGEQTLTLTGFVRSVSNAIYRVNRLNYELANTGGVLLRSFTNAGNQLAVGGEMGLNLFLLKRVKLFLGGSVYQFSVESNETLFGDQSSNSSLNYDIKTNLNWMIIQGLEFTIDYAYTSPTVTPQGEDLEFQALNLALSYSPRKTANWNFFVKMLDVTGTNQSGGYTGATAGERDVFRRYWVYDYEGQILELGASFTFNPRKEKEKQKIIGNEYF